MLSPYSRSGAPGTWKGPSTVDSVAPGDLGLARASTSIERPRLSDQSTNSWRTSSVMWPVSVSTRSASVHSDSVRRVSTANPCRWRTRLCINSRRRASRQPSKLATTAAVMSSGAVLAGRRSLSIPTAPVSHAEERRRHRSGQRQRDAAVDEEYLSREERGFLARQEEERVRDVLGPAVPADWNACGEIPDALRPQ